jgi:prepilin-type N-terminal cleavage/methylation domain-containing protein
MRRDSGFTLIELMIAIALVAILLATAVPALDDFTNDARQTGAINDFISSIHLARNTAITIVSASAAVDGLNIQSGEFPAALMYRPNGRAMTAALTGNSGEFAVCDFRGADHAKVILVEISGRPRMSEKKANGAPPTCI